MKEHLRNCTMANILQTTKALADLKSLHKRMHNLETRDSGLQSSESEDSKAKVEDRLTRLRQQLVLRPRILFSYAMSSKTGYGLDSMRESLSVLMQDQRLFPEVGAKVPLNYSLLERLAQDDETKYDYTDDFACEESKHEESSSEDNDNFSDESLYGDHSSCEMASAYIDRISSVGEVDKESYDLIPWEVVVSKHVKECELRQPTEVAEVRKLCRKSYVHLLELEKVAAKIGINKQELHRALAFLHASGSVLYYSEMTRRGNDELRKTVFMKPQFIIDAIKYVVREQDADDLNDKVREMDAVIRRKGKAEEMALDRFLGCGKGYGAGVLTQKMLSLMWRDIDPRTHKLLLELLKAFKLLRPLPLADVETYLVPAMLPRCELPMQYVTPHWWCPCKASAAAFIHVELAFEQAHRHAEMRIMYKVVGGSLPFGFMSELQVSLAQTECVDQDQDCELHFAHVDRIYGSVLSEAYKSGGGIIREWVVLSQWARKERDRESAVVDEATESCIRVMGWVELCGSSLQGSTDWRLFKRVIKKIENMQESSLGLCLQKMALYVDATGNPAKALEINGLKAKRQILRLEFEDGHEEDVHCDFILPSHSETKLMLPQQPSKQTALSKASHHPRWQVDAFFAKRTNDFGIDVHTEGQVMARIVMDPGCGWDCKVNPQPTIDDLTSSIKLARQRNVRVLHLSGDGKKECGFIWNANDSANAPREFDVESIAIDIGSVSAPNGPMECAVLNACSTEKMGRLLLLQGMPYVLCWKTPVQDETARTLCEHFYRALVEDASGVPNYKRAFETATDAVRLSAHTGGAARLLHAAEDVDASRLSQLPREAEHSLDSDSLLHISTTQRVSTNEGGTSLDLGWPWLKEDVVLFLSKDGESEPIYLWRERPAPPADPLGAMWLSADAAEEPIDAALKALFGQLGLATVCGDMCRELGVTKVIDLADVEKEMIDDLPKYITDQLKPVLKKRLLKIIGPQPTSSAPATAELSGSRLLAPPASAKSASLKQDVDTHPQQVFLGYRVASDADLVERLHDKLKAQGVNVWWDKLSLPRGQPWEQCFANGLCSSDVFVPVLSKAALAPCALLTASSACDNVILQHQLALELQHRGSLRAILPVFVGELRHDNELGDMHGDFFKSGGMPVCIDDVVVEAVECKLVEHLQRLGKGAPQLPASSRTIKATLAVITSNQGVKLLGVRSDTMDNVIADIQRLVTTQPTSATTATADLSRLQRSKAAATSFILTHAADLRPMPAGVSSTAAGSAQTTTTSERLPCIEGFFCRKIPDKKELKRQIESLKTADVIDKDDRLKELESIVDCIDTIDVHKEAEELKMSLTHGRNVYNVSIHAQPSFQKFSECMRSARKRNVCILHFAGHGHSQHGFFWLKHGAATEYEEVQLDKFAGLIKTELAGSDVGGIECVVLNACETEKMGKILRTAGVRHIVCWRSEVEDGTANQFALDFYKSLDQQDLSQTKDYAHAFRQAVARMSAGEGDTRAAQKHLAAGAVDYVCLLSQDGDAFPNTGRIRDLNQGDDSDARKMCLPTGKEDWPALAGQQELALLKALGFNTTPIHNGQGLNDRGMATHDLMRQLWGVEYYSQLWGIDGRSVLVAASVPVAQRTQAVNFLTKALEFRKEDMKRYARNRCCRGMCPPASNCRDCRSRVNHEFMFRLLGESKDAMLAM